ncbi:MAG: hypothetical protein IJN26_03855 [Bacteroidales bacterium]|nr:hypothetical protein [Bacteroidales bacterium]
MKSLKNILVWLGAATVAFSALSCEELPDAVQGMPYTDAATGVFYEWPSYNPTIHYNLKEDPEFKDLAAPSRNLAWNQAAKIYDNGKYWSYYEGRNANSAVKGNEAAIEKMFGQLEADAAYLRDEMGWPPTTNVRKGFRDAVFLYGSQLGTDNASNTDLGGWQSAVNVGGVSYPVVLLSYYPVYCFDPSCDYTDKKYQTEAVTHEYIHAIFASMPGCRKSAWFHEGANCWLQATMNYNREHPDGNYVANDMGWLSTGSAIAPFIPIECYSGWLLDGSFGGPQAQGVNENFRQTIGGIQYSEMFPTFLGEIIGKGSVPWVWNNCTGNVLSGIAEEIGQEQMERMIQEYRARIALCDMGRYSQAVYNLTNNAMGAVYGSDVDGKYVAPWKATPYASTSPVTDEEETRVLNTRVPVPPAVKPEEEGIGDWDDADWLKPDELTLPGWTGANIIPIKVEGDKLLVAFQPYGERSTADNMSCQLCYRTAEGKTVYGNPFKSGSFLLDLSKDRPANDVVFAVVCNLHYTYEKADVRKYKYDYRIKISENAHVANIHKRWYDWQTVTE